MTTNETRYDLVSDLTAFEEGMMDDEEVLRFFQHLVDTGLAWSLQGSYGRMATALLREGLISDDA